MCLFEPKGWIYWYSIALFVCYNLSLFLKVISTGVARPKMQEGHMEIREGFIKKKKNLGIFQMGGEGSDPIPDFFFLEGKFLKVFMMV